MNTDSTIAPQPQPAERLPIGLAWLALGAFAIGTESFMVAGLLPALAADLQVSATRAGQLVLLFALSYAIGSPLMAALCARFGRRPLMIASLAAFSGLTLAASMAQGFAQLALARVALGLVASARPRSAGDTIDAATALAVGRNTPATSPSAMRASANWANPCAIEAARVRPEKAARLAIIRGRRPKRAHSAAISGEPMA